MSGTQAAHSSWFRRVRARAVMLILLASAMGRYAAYRVAEALRGADIERAQGVLQRWCHFAVRCFGLTVRVHGQLPAQRCVLVANHRSYLDIYLLASLFPVSFVSRHDIAAWPIIGGAARATGAIFIDRGHAAARAVAARRIGAALRHSNVVVFSEGTTGGDKYPHAFQAGLFRILADAGIAVVPLTIRYSERRAYWIEDVPLATHVADQVIAPGGLTAAVHIGAALPPTADTRAWAEAARHAICRVIEEFGEWA